MEALRSWDNDCNTRERVSSRKKQHLFVLESKFKDNPSIFSDRRQPEVDMYQSTRYMTVTFSIVLFPVVVRCVSIQFLPMIQFTFEEFPLYGGHVIEILTKNLRKRKNWLKKRAFRMILKGPLWQFIVAESVNVDYEASLISAKVRVHKIHALARDSEETPCVYEFSTGMRTILQ